MFKPIKNGSVVNVQGLECQLPPVGYIKDWRTGSLKNIGVYKRNPKNYKECYWEVDKRFSLYKDWKKKEELTGRKNDELEKFIEDCWLYRMGGFWFYNNDVPTYITGAHWFYLSVFNIDIGLPSYRDVDREFFYVWAYCVEDPESYGLTYMTKRRNGKCLGYDTPIRMYDGSVKMVQDIVDGDVVMGVNSQPRVAFGITKGREEMFRISPKKGIPFTCNRSHILSLKWNGAATHSVYGWEKDGTVNISVDKWLSLKDWEKEHLVLYRVGWDSESENKIHEIDPYMLGLWLGDGCASNGVISSADNEIIEYVSDFCASKGMLLSKRGKYDYQIVTDFSDSDKKWGINWWKECLRKFDLKNNKHIPQDYLIDGRENRLKLLAGLIDTDGHANRTPSGDVTFYEITQKNKELAYQIAELARSLGFYVSIKEKTATLKREGKETYKCLVYRVNICGDLLQIPCKLERKKANKFLAKSAKNRTGFDVESIGDGDYYGFAVDGDHLFLLADGTVTHNTFQACCVGVELVTRIPMFNVGIQSKTENDARSLFRKAVSAPYRQLPYFFVPKVSKSGATGKVSDKELRFVSGKNDDVDDELGGTMDYRSNDEGAYDGYKLGYYFADEVAKQQDCDIMERWTTVKRCLTDYTGEIIGKTIHTTTVEDMEGRWGKTYKVMWDSSNQLERQKNGRTKTGMYRFMVTGDRVRHLDKYGFPDTLKGKEAIEAERDAVRDNPRVLAKTIRQDFLNEREAFLMNSDTCVFNAVLLAQREQEIDPAWNTSEIYKRGRFEWENEEWGDVKFVENPNGDVYIMEEPTEELRNRHGFRGEYRIPANSHIYAMGVDPYEFTIIETKENKKDLSDGAFAIIKKPSDIYPSEFDNGLVCYFRKRLPTPEMFYTQAIMAMIYFGTDALIERNRPGLLSYMKRFGLHHYATLLPNQTQMGIHATQETNNNIFELTDQYINDHISKINVVDLIDDWKGFTPSDTTAYDGAMAFGYALMQWDRRKPKVKTNQNSKPKEVTDYFSMFSRITGEKKIIDPKNPYYWEL